MSLMSEEEGTRIRLEAIQGLSARGATEAVKILLQTVEDTDQRIRLASWGSLGALGDEGNLPALVSLWLRTQSDEELRAAEDAVVAVARNISMDDRPAAAVLAVVNSVDDVRVKSSLLQALGRIGDEGGLGTLRAGLKDNDARIENAAVRALASWPTDEPISDLKTMAQEADSDTHRILALRGYVRMLAFDGDRPEKETAKIYRQALLLAERAEEKKLILAGLANVVHVDALRIVEPYLREAGLKSEAAAAAARIGAEVDESEQIEDEAAQQYVKAVMKTVISVSQNETTIEMAQEVIENINGMTQK
jgi:HEAT repeat protein